MPPSAEHIADTTKTPISTRSTSTPTMRLARRSPPIARTSRPMRVKRMTTKTSAKTSKAMKLRQEKMENWAASSAEPTSRFENDTLWEFPIAMFAPSQEYQEKSVAAYACRRRRPPVAHYRRQRIDCLLRERPCGRPHSHKNLPRRNRVGPPRPPVGIAWYAGL